MEKASLLMQFRTALCVEAVILGNAMALCTSGARKLCGRLIFSFSY